MGYPGALQALASPAPGYSAEDVIRGGTHELLSGANVRDRVGVRRRYTLPWPAMTDTSWNVVRSLARIPGPFRYQDPLEPNLLTANQSTGSDELATTDGAIARFGGSLSSVTTQQRSWRRSFAWTVTPSSTAWGIYLQNSISVVDDSWTAVRPSTVYTVSGYMRSTVAISMKAGIDWYTGAGTFISADTGGSGVALSQANFNTRVTYTAAASPSTAGYGIPWFTNTTTSAANIIYLDEPQMEQAAAASTFRVGVGTPWVSVESLAHDIVLADGATTGAAIHNVELVLLEVG